MFEFYLLTLSVTEERTQILVFTRIELTTSALARVRGYLLDHLGDELQKFDRIKSRLFSQPGQLTATTDNFGCRT